MSDYSSYMWSVPDWRTDEIFTMLDNREQGIYRNLIDECWVQGSITSDPELLARFVREPLDYFLPVWAKLRPKFHSIEGGKKLISPRLEQDRRRLMLNAKFNQKRARKAAESRWNKSKAEKELHARSIFVASPEHAFEHCQIQTQTQEEGSSLINRNLIINTSPGYRTSRKTLAPETLTITEGMRSWAAKNGIVVNLETETAAMLDYHHGKGSLHLDWIATWRTWMRNSLKFSHRGNGNGSATKESYGDRIARENRETAERLHHRLHDSIIDGNATESDGRSSPALLSGAKRPD